MIRKLGYLLLIPCVAHAAFNDLGRFYYDVELGGTAWVAQNSAKLAPMPSVNLSDQYVTTNKNTTAYLSAGTGFEFNLPKLDSLPGLTHDRLGIMYEYIFPSTGSGNINKWQSVDAYDYSFRTYSNVLWLDNQLDFYQYDKLTTFFRLSFGISANTATNYAESPVPANDDPRAQGAAFADYTTYNFAYRVGLGITYQLPIEKTPTYLSLAYQYANYGQAQLGNSSVYPTANAPVSATLAANELLLSLRYYY